MFNKFNVVVSQDLIRNSGAMIYSTGQFNSTFCNEGQSTNGVIIIKGLKDRATAETVGEIVNLCIVEMQVEYFEEKIKDTVLFSEEYDSLLDKMSNLRKVIRQKKGRLKNVSNLWVMVESFKTKLKNGGLK